MENDILGFESDGLSSGVEQSKETQEKQKAQSQKAQSQLQKVQKDEKKAQGDDRELFEILKKFINNPYYSSLIPDITFLLSHSIPSRAILAMIALFYPEASYYISQTISKEKDFEMMKNLHKYETLTDFNESTLDASLRSWITIWVTFMETFLTHSTTSTIMMAKFAKQIQQTYPNEINDVFTHFLIFFFQTRNIKIQKNNAVSYSQYIQKNLIKVLIQFLENENAEDILRDIENISVDNLFGVK
ncbi:hypothetical protein CSB09_01115 [Candidatus Gracilibacteria bacterium]|nr:MAG: hypothetical protein CSB09_01115 [Candidatus Gracilibacteria bacterium]